MSYETPSHPRIPVAGPASPTRRRDPDTVGGTASPPTWRVGKCLTCLGRGRRTVYRPLGGGVYLPRTVRCERCEGSGRWPRG